MRVLIVGARGQLGQELQATAPQRHQVHAIARPELDLNDREGIEKTVRELAPDVTVNAAAYTAVDRAEGERQAAFAVNATGAGWLAESVSRHGGRLIHVSTDFVFAGDSDRAYRPQDQPAPLSVYAQSKYEGEILVRQAAGDRSLIVRTSWVYSRFGSNFVKTMLGLLCEREIVEVVADQHGSPTWAKRLARVLWEFVGRPDLTGIFHWTDSGTTSWYELALAIQEEASALGLLERSASLKPVRTEDFGARAPRPSHSALDCRETLGALEVEPWHWRRSLREMLAELRA